MKNNELERHDMHAIIERGESVLLNGVLITRHEDLPSAVSMAKNDPEELARVQADLLARRQEINRQLDEAQQALDAASSEDTEENEIGDEDTDDVGGTNPKPVRRRPAPLGQNVVTSTTNTKPGQQAIDTEE